MEPFDYWVVFWLGLSLCPYVVVVVGGVLRLRIGLEEGRRSSVVHKFSFVTVCIPLKGVFPGQRELLLSLVGQNHPDFEVVFILESERDGAKSVVDEICREFSHCRTVISGPASTCAQKNHSLISGLRSLPSHTKIFVFCDGNSRATPDWLVSMTQPIEMNRFEAVTTFRAFQPEAPTLSGVCHAVYASFITLSKAFFPKPWGGGTAIRRENPGCAGDDRPLGENGGRRYDPG